MAELETSRLLLRPLTADDFDDFAAMMADPQVGRFLSAERGMSPEDAWRSLAVFIGHHEMRGYSNWAVIEKDTGRFVGRAGPWQPHGWPGLEIAWCLAREHWGKGYATEAARAALGYCYEELHAHQVVSLIAPANVQSIRVAQRIRHAHLGETVIRGTPCHIYGQTLTSAPDMS